MKIILFTLSTLTILISGKLDNNLDVNQESTLTSQTELIGYTQSPNLVSACYYDGELIPTVQLPTLNVIAKKEPGTIVSTIIYEGEAIPIVQLPTLNIIAKQDLRSNALVTL